MGVRFGMCTGNGQERSHMKQECSYYINKFMKCTVKYSTEILFKHSLRCSSRPPGTHYMFLKFLILFEIICKSKYPTLF